MSISMKQKLSDKLLSDNTNRTRNKYGTYEHTTQIGSLSTLSFSNICFVVDKISERDPVTRQKTTTSKFILTNISGKVCNGELFGIIGASGCGKTTLISVLSGRIHKISNLSSNCAITGNIYYNNNILDAQNKSHLSTLSNHSSLVMQEDIFQPTMKVNEAIEFSAHLRVAHNSEQRIKQSVQEIISDLELNTCQETIIGNDKQYRGISGGEKKRVSIGVELICDHNFIILDEPTTGLDSVNALNIMQKLKKITEKNKVVITSLHQPSYSIIELLDKIMILSKGCVVYCGSIHNDQLIQYMTNELQLHIPKYCNLIEVFLEAVKKDRDHYIQQWIEYSSNRKNKTQFDNIVIDEKGNDDFWTFKPYKSGICKQFKWLLWREIKVTLRDPLLYKMRLWMILILALICCMIYYKITNDCSDARDRYGLSYLLVAMSCFQAMGYNIFAFPLSKAVFERERKSSQMYSTCLWVIIKSIVSLPQLFAMALVLTLVTNLIIGLNSRIFVQFYILSAVSMYMDSVSFIIGCLCSSLETAAQVAPMVIFPLFLYSNFYVTVESIPQFVRWIKFISPYYLGTNEFVTEEFISGPVQRNCEGPPGVFNDRSGAFVLENILNINPSEKELYMWLLLGGYIWWRFIGVLLLVKRHGL
eukprot:25289_1